MKMHTPVVLWLALIGCLGACLKGTVTNPGGTADGGTVDGGAVDGGAPTTSDPVDMPGQQPATTTPDPTAPKTEDGLGFGGPTAPLMDGVQVVANRDSVVLVVPAVSGVADYRAFRLPAGSKVTTVNGGEQVDGTVLHCAGYRQHNDAFTGTRELLRQLEVTDLDGPVDLVVEAIDAPCPFPGLLAPVHEELQVLNDEVVVADRIAFSFFTAAEIRARFGSLVVNGQGPGATLAAPGPTTPPRVLARTTVHVTPTGRASPRTTDFFDDFDGTSGPITFDGEADDASRAYAKGRHLSNTRWDFYVYDDHLRMAQLSEERGLLHVTLPDWTQDVFATVVAVARRPAKLASDRYLHLTFEVASNATSRRYWWVGLCGAGTPGATFDAQRHFTGRLVQTSFFYQPDGRDTSVEGWNCLQFFPRDGSPFPLPPSNRRSESDVRVMVNQADAGVRESVVNLSPAQYPAYEATPSWFRQQDASGELGAPVLDEQLLIAPRTRFDAYVRRDRLVLYVNGAQRLCNDFAKYPLTMAEGAVAFGQVLYHSAAERLEFSRSYDDRTGQRYYLENTPYADQRDWDNVGYEEDLAAPAGLDEARCFQAP